MRNIPSAVISLAVLLAGSWIYWQYRYEEYPGYARLAFRSGAEAPYQVTRSADAVQWDSAARRMSIQAMPGKSPTVEMDWQGWPRDGYAHVRIAGRAVGLVRGSQEWDDGRVVVVWRDDDGKIQRGCAGLLGASGNQTAESDLIVPLHRSGHPSAVIQNLGVAGTLVIERLEVTLVRLRWWGWPATVGLLAGWFFWSLMVMRRWVAPDAGSGRLVAAGILTVIALYFMILPGPWVPYRSIVSRFSIASTAESATTAAPQAGVRPPSGGAGAFGVATNQVPEAVVPLNGEVPGKLRSGKFWEAVYAMKSYSRPALHLSIFAGMAVILVAVLCSRRAVIPVIAMAAATEAIETLLGFGFDWDDVGDLFWDGMGIWLGYWFVWRWLVWCGRAGVPGNFAKK